MQVKAPTLRASNAHRGLLVATLLVAACGARPLQTAPPPLPPSPPAVMPPAAAASAAAPSAPTAPAPPSPGCVVDADCPATAPRVPRICTDGRCQATTAAALWQWALGLVPELAGRTRPFAFRLDEWIPAATRSVVLWVDARVLWDHGPARCVSLRFEPHEGQLAVDVSEKLGARAGAPDVWTYTLTLGYSAAMLGPGRVRRDGSAAAIGGLRVLGGSLGGASRDVLRYDGVRYEPTIACRVSNVAGDPRCPRCDRCVGFSVGERRLEMVRFPVTAHAPQPTISFYDPRRPPRCGPCPPEKLRPELPRLQRAMAGQVFVRVFDEGPAFFRRQTACVADLRSRKLRPQRQARMAPSGR